MPARSEYLEAGKIVNTHGVKGNVKIESWCDSPSVLASLKKIYFKRKNGEYIPIDVESSFVHKGHAIMSLSGIDDIDDALKYKGALVFAARKDIPIKDGSVFVCDLVGLPVIDADSGEVYGKVVRYVTGPAQDLYEVELPPIESEAKESAEEGAEELPAKPRLCYIPSVEQFIDRVELESGVYIRPIEGLIE